MAQKDVPMSGKHYPNEFKIEAVKQVVARGHLVSSVQHALISPLIAFIRDNSRDFPVHLLRRVLDVHPSSFCVWLQQPHSRRYRSDQKLTGLIKSFWLESGCVYGYRKIHLDLRDTGETVDVATVMITPLPKVFSSLSNVSG